MGALLVQKADRYGPIHPMSAGQTVQSRRQPDQSRQSTRANWADDFGALQWSASPVGILDTLQNLDSHRSIPQFRGIEANKIGYLRP